MNKDKLGHYSIIMALVSLFFCNFYILNGTRGFALAIFIAIMSGVAIILGLMTFIMRGQGKIKATIGILLGAFFLTIASNDLLFPENALTFKPGFKGAIFLRNSNTVGLRYCNSYNDCFIKYTYDVSTQKFIEQEKSNDLDKYSFSRDGRKVVFIDGSEDEKNIFIMNTDGSERRQLTHSSDKDTIIVRDDDGIRRIKVNNNSCPSFTPDGKRVIFIRSTLKFKYRSGFSYLRDCDIYEVDIDAGNERRLTNKNFPYVSCPKYFSDGKRFIFSQGGHIYIIDEISTELSPMVTHSLSPHNPSISFDDKIVFIANRDEVTSYKSQVFIKVGDKIKRLTDMKSTPAIPQISSDGNWIVFEESGTNEKTNLYEYNYWIMKSDGTGLKKLTQTRVGPTS